MKKIYLILKINFFYSIFIILGVGDVMISDLNIQELQNKRRDLQADLSTLLNTSNSSVDDINEIKSEIHYIEKLIEKKVGSNELKRLEEVKNKKSSKDNINIKMYNALKNRYYKIRRMDVATRRFMSLTSKDYEYENVKVKN